MKNPVTDETMLASGDYLAVVREFAFSKGIDPSILLDRSEIPLNDLIHPPALILNMIVSGIGSNLYHALDNPIADAVELGLRMNSSTHGSLGVAIQCAPDIKTGLEILSEYFNTRLNSQNIVLIEMGEFLDIQLVNKFDDPELETGIQEFFDIMTLVSIASSSLRTFDSRNVDGHIRLAITSSMPADFPHEQLGDKIKAAFNQERVALSFPTKWMDIPLFIANQEMSQAALEQCETELKQISPKDLVARVIMAIRDAEDSIPSLTELAKLFCMSPATFKRRLKEHGTSYQALKDTERYEQAKSLIVDSGLSLESIAEQLGFSDASNFSKSFKNWSGMSPGVFRTGKD